MAHKGNCRFCKERRQKQLEELLIKLKGKYRYVCSKYLSKKKVKYVDMDTPSNNSFKSYMSYKCITNRSSKQYKFQQECYTGNYGIRMKDGRYCIYLSSFFLPCLPYIFV